ncbi:hypothetical protein NFI96_013724, partial [Prochilodus magdalenae]
TSLESSQYIPAGWVTHRHWNPIAMMRTAIVLTLALMVTTVSAQTFVWGTCPFVPVLPAFQLTSYLGTWYEISKLPAAFERGKCIEARYSQRSDQTISVLNVQTVKGKVKTIEGTAVVQNMLEPGKLGVSFSRCEYTTMLHPTVGFCFSCLIGSVTPYSPYWVLYTDYNNVAVVYSCTEFLRLFHVKYAWILSRSRVMNPQEFVKAQAILAGAGVDLTKMTFTDQLTC